MLRVRSRPRLLARRLDAVRLSREPEAGGAGARRREGLTAFISYFIQTSRSCLRLLHAHPVKAVYRRGNYGYGAPGLYCISVVSRDVYLAAARRKGPRPTYVSVSVITSHIAQVTTATQGLIPSHWVRKWERSPNMDMQVTLGCRPQRSALCTVTQTRLGEKTCLSGVAPYSHSFSSGQSRSYIKIFVEVRF